MVREGFKCTETINLSTQSTDVDACAELVRNDINNVDGVCEIGGFFMMDSANQCFCCNISSSTDYDRMVAQTSAYSYIGTWNIFRT